MSKIVTAFHQVCQQNSDVPAFYYRKNRQVLCKTFSEVEQDVSLAANLLRNSGVQTGDRLLTFASPNYNLIVFILAAFQIGAAVMYIDIFARQDTMARLFQKYQPQFVLVSRRTQPLKLFFPEISKIKQVINVDNLNQHKSSLQPPEPHTTRKKPEVTQVATAKSEDATAQSQLGGVPEAQAALLTTTTGSTSLPKIVVRTHADLLAQLNLIRQNIELPQVHPVVLTTSYIYVFANLLQGFTTVLPNLNLRQSSRALNRKLRLFQNLPINMIITSPDFCLKTENLYPSLEHLYFGGAILNLVEAKSIYQKFCLLNNLSASDPDLRRTPTSATETPEHKSCPANITYIYGCTECNLISTNSLSQYIKDLERRGISNLGKVIKGVKVKIGAQNEICVQSDAQTDHYLGRASRKSKDYYDTSDRGYLLDGSLIYLGKANGILHTPQGIVYSSQVEQDLVLRFGFAKCAILEEKEKFYLFVEKSPHRQLTRRIFKDCMKHCVQQKPKISPTLTEISHFVQEKYQITPIVRFIRQIPCDVKHHTKINYQKLRKEIK